MNTATNITSAHQQAFGSKHLSIRYRKLASEGENAMEIKHRNKLSKRMYPRFFTGILIAASFVIFGLLYQGSSLLLHATLLLSGGFACWTFMEYALHRFFVHAGKQIFGYSFLDCDRYPTRAKRLKLFFVWIVIFIMALAVSRLLFIAVGVVGGWLWYCYMRVFVQWKGMAKLLPGLHRQHLYHLAGGHDKGFGWTTTWWDVWFKTTVPLGYIYSPGHGKRYNHAASLFE